jgi:hypothetical protein
LPVQVVILATGGRYDAQSYITAVLITVLLVFSGELPVVAERAMYWHLKGGGHDSIGLMEN